MPSISKVAISNMALSNIGAGSIESLAEDSPEANQCERWYDWSRVKLLESFNWSFAKRRALLATHSDAAPTNEWAYRYQYPSEALKIRYLENPAGKTNDPIPFDIELDDDGETKSIVTDLSEARAVYTADIETTGLFNAHFMDTLAFLLASKIAYPITRKSGVKAYQERQYRIGLNTAPTYDKSESQAEAPREAEAVIARA